LLISQVADQSWFSGPTTAHTVFPDGIGVLPQARQTDSTIARPDTQSPPQRGSGLSS